MPLPEKKSYTYADILEMDGDERFELIDGELIMMSPPSRKHQKISGELFVQLYNYLKGKKCEVYASPFGVRLFEKDNDKPWQVNAFVEPDIVVVCDPNKLDDAGCKGAPDLVIEILSPSNKKHDLLVKHKLYQRAGVREYWIVDPNVCAVIVYTLQENGIYSGGMLYYRDSSVPVGVLDDCEIDLNTVFDGI